MSERLVSSGQIPETAQKEAISRIGTNALPSLVKWIAYSAPKRHLRLFGMNIPLPSRERRAELAQGSFIALRSLGVRAAPALPDLVYLLKGTNIDVAERALSSIDGIGMAGVPALLDYVTNRHAYSCSSALPPVGAMRNLGTNGAFVVPVLTECLKSSDSEIAGIAAILLANIGQGLGVGAQADVVVAALVGATGSPDEHVRYCAVYALRRFDAFGKSVVPALVRALGDSDVQVRKAATNSLDRVARQILGARNREHDF